MRRIHRMILTAGIVLLATPMKLTAWRLPGVIPDTPVAVVEQVIPDEAMPGEVVTVRGYGLDVTNVRQVYLLWGKSEFKVQILKQSSTAIRFRVPVDMPPGPMRLAVMVAGRPELVEQPVMLTVLEGAMTARRHIPTR
jgi:hypothetical protein